MSVQMAILMLPGLVLGLTVHEFAHAWTASLLGDDFARRQGRVSLSPIRHLSPLGTLALLVLPFGWGRPVPVNVYNFARPRRDFFIVSLAGPTANILVVACCLVLMQLTRHDLRWGGWGAWWMTAGHCALVATALLNAVLATVNLIPIPPLDGSRIWPCILPAVKPVGRPRRTWISLAVLVALLSTGSLRPLIGFAMDHVVRLMPPSDSRLLAERERAALDALRNESWAEAEALCTEALAIDRRSHESLYGRAMARYWQDDLQGGLEDINRAIDIHLSPDYYQMRALILRELGRNQEADDDEALARVLRGSGT